MKFHQFLPLSLLLVTSTAYGCLSKSDDGQPVSGPKTYLGALTGQESLALALPTPALQELENFKNLKAEDLSSALTALQGKIKHKANPAGRFLQAAKLYALLENGNLGLEQKELVQKLRMTVYKKVAYQNGNSDEAAARKLLGPLASDLSLDQPTAPAVDLTQSVAYYGAAQQLQKARHLTQEQKQALSVNFEALKAKKEQEDTEAAALEARLKEIRSKRGETAQKEEVTRRELELARQTELAVNSRHDNIKQGLEKTKTEKQAAVERQKTIIAGLKKEKPAADKVKEHAELLKTEETCLKTLEASYQQAGLSWETVLKKRKDYRIAFHHFDPAKVASMSDDELEALRQNLKIIRNRLKIYGARQNAQAFLKIQQEFGSFDHFVWSFVNNKPIINHWKRFEDVPVTTTISDALSKDLKKRGMTFVGSTIIYAYMQAVGLVNDHITKCWRYDR